MYRKGDGEFEMRGSVGQHWAKLDRVNGDARCNDSFLDKTF